MSVLCIMDRTFNLSVRCLSVRWGVILNTTVKEISKMNLSFGHCEVYISLFPKFTHSTSKLLSLSEVVYFLSLSNLFRSNRSFFLFLYYFIFLILVSFTLLQSCLLSILFSGVSANYPFSVCYYLHLSPQYCYTNFLFYLFPFYFGFILMFLIVELQGLGLKLGVDFTFAWNNNSNNNKNNNNKNDKNPHLNFWNGTAIGDTE